MLLTKEVLEPIMFVLAYPTVTPFAVCSMKNLTRLLPNPQVLLPCVQETPISTYPEFISHSQTVMLYCNSIFPFGTIFEGVSNPDFSPKMLYVYFISILITSCLHYAFLFG